MKQLTKRERIEFLLDHWPDFFETLHTVDESGDHVEGAVTGMPKMSRHPSVVELGRAIAATRRHMPKKTAHLMAHYTSEWRTTDKLERRRTKKGKQETVTRRVRERVVPKWVRPRKVELAVIAVTAEFRGEVFIPDELLEAVAA